MELSTQDKAHADYFTLPIGAGLLLIGTVLMAAAPQLWIAAVLWITACIVGAPVATYVTARDQRVRQLSASFGLAWLGICAAWPLPLRSRSAALPALVPVLVLGYLVRVIGRVRVATFMGGDEKGGKVTQRLDLLEARAALPTWTKAVGLPAAVSLERIETDGGRVRRFFKMPAGAVADPKLVAQKDASFYERGADTVTAWVPKDDNGMLVVEHVNYSYFTDGMPCPPPRAGVLHMGHLDSGRILNLTVSGDDAGHVIAAGQTRSGKSETLRQWICQWLLQKVAPGRDPKAGVILWAGDPSGGKSLRKYRRFYDRFVTTPDACVQLLVQAAQEIEDRYQLMEMDPAEPDQWQGDWLAVAVDEIPQVLRVGGDVAVQAVQSIVERGAGARVALGLAMLSPRSKLLGDEGAKGQFPTRFAHRLADSTEVGLALRPGAVKELGEGRGPTKITAKGRAFVALNHEPGYPEVQVFKAPEPEALLAAGVPVLNHPAVLEPEHELSAWAEVAGRPADLHVNTPAYAHAREPAGRPAGHLSVVPEPKRQGGKYDVQVLTAVLSWSSEGWMPGRQVAAAVGCSHSTAQAALKRLLAQGKVQQGADGGWLAAGAPVSDDGQPF